MMNDESYVVIQGWMRTKLNLSGSKLIAYAIIYGFSQDDDTEFYGSLSYIAEWCGISRPGVCKMLKEMCDDGLLSKREDTVKGVKCCFYKALMPDDASELTVLTPVNRGVNSAQPIINNINNNIDIPDGISITDDYIINKPTVSIQEVDNKEKENKRETIGISNINSTKEKPKEKESRYYPDNEELDGAFSDYVAMRKKIRKPMTDRAIELAKSKLEKLSKGNESLAVQILEQSILNSWQGLFELRLDHKETVAERLNREREEEIERWRLL